MSADTGGMEEQVPSIFDEDPDLFRQKLERDLRRIRSALTTSGVLIVLPLLISQILSFRLLNFRTMSVALVALLIVFVYMALGAFAMRKPFSALLAGIGVYALMQAAVIVLSPQEAFTAWIFRALVLMNLLMPVQKARAIQRRIRI